VKGIYLLSILLFGYSVRAEIREFKSTILGQPDDTPHVASPADQTSGVKNFEELFLGQPEATAQSAMMNRQEGTGEIPEFKELFLGQPSEGQESVPRKAARAILERKPQCANFEDQPSDNQQKRDRAIWEQPDCESECPLPSGRPISYWRFLECAKVEVHPYGFVLWEGFWDSRQPVGSREQEGFLFPAPQLLDVLCQDINDHGEWQMTAVTTRIGVELLGPHWDDIKVNGRIEADFRGATDASISCLRMRHALGIVDWGTGTFLFGQWWHPLFILECFPHTVSFDISAPMDPQARDPQLRVTQKWGWFELQVAAASQRDFGSNGPIGIASDYIRDSVMPNFHLQMRGYTTNNMFGVAADYKRLVPRISSTNPVTNQLFKVDEYFDSFIFEAFAAFNQPPWSLRMKAIWAQNANDQLMISGFGVRCRNPITYAQTYSPTACAGAWLDFTYIFGCDNNELGIFVGGTKNLGSRHRLFIDPTTHLPTIFALTQYGPNIDYVWRISPRYIFMKDPIRFGAELEITQASFGTPNAFGRVCNGVPVTNYRVIFVLYYMF
jgi:hypothetical protein